MDIFWKKNLINYGIFSGILIVICTILILLSVFSYKSKNKSYIANVQTVLDRTINDNNNSSFQKKSKKLAVIRPLKVHSSFELNASVFELSDSLSYAVLIKVQTIFGPNPAVFLYNSNGTIEFLDFVFDNGKVSSVLKNSKNDVNFFYNKNKIASIMKKIDFNSRK